MATLRSILPIIQIVLAIFVSISILLQQRGGGLSATFGGDGNIYRTKRGVEKFIFRASIVFIILLVATAIINIVLP